MKAIKRRWENIRDIDALSLLSVCLPHSTLLPVILRSLASCRYGDLLKSVAFGLLQSS